MTDRPLTLGTAGHIDHGKTALVRALTGVDTDRLPEERKRGISIDLGYAPLRLPGGRTLSVIDVPGHERYVRTMVAGATGVDLFLFVVAADDGVMPQTIEHTKVLKALGVTRGVVAVTKCDIADPQAATESARELLEPWAETEVVPCSARTGAGVADVAAALERVVGRWAGRAAGGCETILHVDRSFTVRGAGTVVTGTLWSGEAVPGDRLTVLPGGFGVRVRSVHVHDEAVERAAAGQRVALNLVGVAVNQINRGDVVATASALRPTHILDAALKLHDAPSNFRATIHHGTRETPGRLAALGEDWWQLRVARPLLAVAGDRLVVRSIAPPDTLGGGTIIDPYARHHGPSLHVVRRLERIRRGEAAETPSNSPEPAPRGETERVPLSPAALALERRVRAAGHEPPNDAELGPAVAELQALRDAGRVVRVGRSMYAHVDTVTLVGERVRAILEADGHITVARLRDELATSRKYAIALLEHLDAARVTIRMPDDTRIARKRH